jgi:hypothetical protein
VWDSLGDQWTDSGSVWRETEAVLSSVLSLVNLYWGGSVTDVGEELR